MNEKGTYKDTDDNGDDDNVDGNKKWQGRWLGQWEGEQMMMMETINSKQAGVDDYLIKPQS